MGKKRPRIQVPNNTAPAYRQPYNSNQPYNNSNQSAPRGSIFPAYRNPPPIPGFNNDGFTSSSYASFQKTSEQQRRDEERRKAIEQRRRAEEERREKSPSDVKVVGLYSDEEEEDAMAMSDYVSC